MNTNTKYKVVYRMDYAMRLIEKGFTPIATMPNPQKPRLNSWIFERSDEFDLELNILKGGRHNGRE